MARTKAVQADNDSAPAGHNLTPTETRAKLFRHFNAVEEAKALVKAAQEELKRRRKAAKAEDIVMADLDYMARCANLEDPTIVPAEILRRAEIASWFALPIEFQPDMFTDRSPIDATAFKQGETAALLGKSCEPAFGADSSTGQSWIAGWHEGQRQRREDMEADMLRRNAEKDELIKGAGADPEFLDDEDEAA